MSNIIGNRLPSFGTLLLPVVGLSVAAVATVGLDVNLGWTGEDVVCLAGTAATVGRCVLGLGVTLGPGVGEQVPSQNSKTNRGTIPLGQRFFFIRPKHSRDSNVSVPRSSSSLMRNPK